MVRSLSLVCAILVCASFGDPEPKPAHVTGLVLGPDLAPLPEYTLELFTSRPDPAQKGAMKTRLERVTTNAKGEFESALAYTPGPVRFKRIDTDATTLIVARGDLDTLAPDNRGRIVERELDGEPLHLHVACGPTFELAWKKREVAEDERDGPAVGGARARLLSQAPGGVDEGAYFTTSVRALDDSHGWVRFGGLPFVDEQSLTGLPSQPIEPDPRHLVLEVVSSDGLWKSTADVTEAWRAHDRKVELEWVPCCRWTGSIAGGQPSPTERIWITAERLDEKDNVVERRRKRIEPGGGVPFRGLDPGRWRFASSALRFANWSSATYELEKSKSVSAKIDLVPIKDGVTFACRVSGGPVVEGGRPGRPGRAWISRSGPILPLEEKPLAWVEREGQWIVPLEFEGVPPGEYALVVVPMEDDRDEFGSRLTSLSSTAGGPIRELVWRWHEESR